MIRISQKFSEARHAKHLTLDDASKATKIRKDFLQAIEDGNYKKLPSTAYAYGFVRNYAKFLDMDEKESLAIFKREFDAEKVYDVLPKSLTKKDEFPIKKIKIGRGLILISIVFLLIAGFVFLQYRSALFNPSLVVTIPQELSVVNTQDAKISGHTDPNSAVYIQNQLVDTDSSGNFSKILTLFPGRTTIIIKSVNRFGRVSVIERHVEVRVDY